jgi:hypothetical protein
VRGVARNWWKSLSDRTKQQRRKQPRKEIDMAHVVTAKRTAKEGEEGTVLDAIEKRQPRLPQ